MHIVSVNDRQKLILNFSSITVGGAYAVKLISPERYNYSHPDRKTSILQVQLFITAVQLFFSRQLSEYNHRFLRGYAVQLSGKGEAGSVENKNAGIEGGNGEFISALQLSRIIMMISAFKVSFYC